MTRGLVAGNMKYRRFSDENWIECSTDQTDWCIPITSLWSRAVHAIDPFDEENMLLIESNAMFLILVEKEGIFHRLVEDRLYE